MTLRTHVLLALLGLLVLLEGGLLLTSCAHIPKPVSHINDHLLESMP